MIHIAPGIWIDPRELEFRCARSGGPGGQNVNKVSSAVQLRFNVRASPSLGEPVRQRLAGLAGRRLTRQGVLVLDARRHRSQKLNRAEAVERLVELIRRAARPPAPRRATAPTAASRRRRQEAKRHRARTKQARRAPGPE